MKCIKNIIRLKKDKMFVLSIIFIILLVFAIAIPTLSKYKSAILTDNIVPWDGTIATSYKQGDGSEDNPYIISNGNELAYFASQLKNINYEGKYFSLSNDIVLNEGVFSYNSINGIKYITDDFENFIEPNVENSLVKEFEHLNGFKGIFNGNSHIIYGLYIDEPINEQNALFTNLEGTISNLYIKNSIIYGGNFVGGIASKSKNSIIENVSYDGFVIANKNSLNKSISLSIDDIEKSTSTYQFDDYINISTLNSIEGIITEITLSGYYETDNSDAILEINGEVINTEEFNINLNGKLKTKIPINYKTNSESTFRLKNLKYEIKYDYSNAAGIVSIAENTMLKNVINKAKVYSNVYSSGIVNTIIGNTSLKNVYNVGEIESSNISTGLISSINLNQQNVTITNCYNSGNLLSSNSALIGNLENNVGNIVISNSFETKDNYVINIVDATMVEVINSYVVSDKKIKFGSSIGEFEKITIDELKNKNFSKNTLKFGEYVDSQITDDFVWVWNFETDFLPILYIDELNTPISSIYIYEKSWDKYKNKLDSLKFSDKLVLGVEELSPLNPIKEVYYYISNEKEVFTKEKINNINDWQKYDGIVEISDEGVHVVYVKVINSNDEEIYINTDLLIIDFTGADITIYSSNISDNWKEFDSNIINYYINKKININIKAEDSLSGVSKIYYYISDKKLSKEDIESLKDWNEYVGEFYIEIPKAIVYVKVLDNYEYATYANTDLFILNGYKLNSIFSGMRGSSLENNFYITDKSIVSLHYSYQDDNGYVEESKHQVVSNVLLPKNTKITLIDKIKNKSYMYKTTEADYGYNDCENGICEAKYDFELFSEIGTKIKFEENNYTGIINEEFVLIIDFNDTQIEQNIENISISLRINATNLNETRNTLVDDMKTFNIISGNNYASFNLLTTFEDVIKYSENSNYIIDFSTKMDYKEYENEKVLDTTFEDKIFGLSIKMIDFEGNIVSKHNLKNVSFELDNKRYSPSSDGIVRIILDNDIKDITNRLIIHTYSDNSDLEEGNYKFIMSLYAAYDGLNSNEILASLEIPVYVGENVYNNEKSFNVIMSDQDKIVTSDENEFDFEIFMNDMSENTNIKISLYEKKTLSAYDQVYTKIDLGNFLVKGNVEEYMDQAYCFFPKTSDNNKLNFKLNTSLLEKKGYMFSFELYEDGKLINRISKKFIVK